MNVPAPTERMKKNIARRHPDLARKLAGLERILLEMKSVAVAFSGGVDSALLAAVAGWTLVDSCLAVTVASPFVSKIEIKQARALARLLRLRHELLRWDNLLDTGLAANPPDRCYKCKLEIMRRIHVFARSKGLAWVADGSQRDDAADNRPGRRATRELGIRSPLAEAGFNKRDVRLAAKLYGLPNADEPAMACLATRFPHGVKITKTELARVEQAEKNLRSMGFAGGRVRSHGNLARVEIAPADILRAAGPAMRKRLCKVLRRAGFRFAALDLAGYRMGSMNS